VVLAVGRELSLGLTAHQVRQGHFRSVGLFEGSHQSQVGVSRRAFSISWSAHRGTKTERNG
jgi:hypothetical protein